MTVLFSVDLLYLVTTKKSKKSKCCKVTVPDGSYYNLLSKKTMSDSVASYQTRPALTNSKHAARESKEAACSESAAGACWPHIISLAQDLKTPDIVLRCFEPLIPERSPFQPTRCKRNQV